MQVKTFADCSKGSILQYFRPSLSYHLSLRFLFCLFLSGRLRIFYRIYYTSIREYSQFYTKIIYLDQCKFTNGLEGSVDLIITGSLKISSSGPTLFSEKIQPGLAEQGLKSEKYVQFSSMRYFILKIPCYKSIKCCGLEKDYQVLTQSNQKVIFSPEILVHEYAIFW